MVKLILKDGKPIWVRPEHVISVEPAPLYDSLPDKPGGDPLTVCTLHLRDHQNGWIIQGTVDDIAYQLDHPVSYALAQRKINAFEEAYQKTMTMDEQ